MYTFWQKLDASVAQRSHSVDHWSEHVHGSYEVHQSVNSLGNQQDRVKRTGNTSVVDSPGTLVLHHDLEPNRDSALQSHEVTHSESSKINGTVKVLPGQLPTENAGFSSPLSTSFSPGRYLTSYANNG